MAKDNFLFYNPPEKYHRESKSSKLFIPKVDLELKQQALDEYSYDDGFSPSGIIDGIISSGIDPAIFDEINEKDIPRAPNFFTWCTGKDFLSVNPFPKQVLIGSQLFMDYCPCCSDITFMEEMFNENEAEILDKLTFLEFGVCPKCHKTRLDLIADKKLDWKHEGVVVAGMRAGKTALTGMLATYQLHRFLMLSSPARFFGQLPGTIFHMTFAALTAGQAEDTLWDNFNGLKTNSPWYKEYDKFLHEHEIRLGARFVHKLENSFVYENKGICGEFTGADYRTMKGRTRIFAAIDELGFFNALAATAKVKMNADEIYAALNNSLQTIRSASMKLVAERKMIDIPTGIFFNISSPCHKDDKIMQLLREAQIDKSKVAYHYATWEFNPLITEDSLETEKAKHPESFDKDFGAVAPMSDSPFLDADIVERTLGDYKANDIDVAEIEYKIEKNELGDSTKFAKVKIRRPDKATPRVMAIDTGYSNNSFSVIVMHYNPKESKAKIDLLIEVVPDELNRVSFPKMFNECILPIISGFRIEFVFYDRWQSFNHIQELRNKKIKTYAISLKWKDFDNFRNIYNSGEILIPKAEKDTKILKDTTIDLKSAIIGCPALHLIAQLFTVRQLGKKVIKPANGTDDTFRTLVLAAICLFDEERRPLFKVVTVGNQAAMSNRSLGVVKTKSGSSGAGVSSSSIGVIKSKSKR